MSGVLALDVGTSALKAAVFDPELVDLVEVPLEVSHPAPGWAEQDPAAWWAALVEAVGRLGGRSVEAVAVTGQMQDLICLDARAHPVGPALLYSDQRATAQHQELVERFGTDWSEAVGPVDATNLAAKWAWLAAHRPEQVAATEQVAVGAAGAIVGRLCATVACDATSAATTGLWSRGAWWAPLVEHLGIPLAPLAEGRVGELSAEAATELGLEPGVPVVLAPGDAVATTVGVVGSTPGRAYAHLGTSGWVGVLDEGRRSAPGALRLPGPEAGIELVVAPLLTGGGALDWFREVVLGGVSPAELDEMAQGRCGAAEGVVFVPHLDGCRFPRPDPAASGVLVGMRRHTERGTLAAAAHEGVAQALNQLVELVDPGAERLVLCGGGARSAWGAQVLADVTGVEVAVVDESHATVRGAAAAGYRALGGPGLDPPVPERVCSPDPERHRAHRSVSRIFGQLVDNVSTISGSLSGS